MQVNGSIAYVSQAPWIQSGTIQDNIMYGKPMEQSRYNEAIKACALGKDLDSFDHGDLTEVGQRGLNLLKWRTETKNSTRKNSLQ